MKFSGKNIGELFAVISAVSIGLNSVIGRFLIVDISPGLPWLGRTLVAVPVMFLIFYLKNRGFKFLDIRKNDLKPILASAVCYSLSGIFFFNSLLYMSAGNAAILEKLDLVFIFIISVVILHSEKISWYKIFGTALMIFGCMVLGMQSIEITPLGFAMGIAAAFLASISAIIDKKIRARYPPDNILFYKLFFALFIIFAYVGATGEMSVLPKAFEDWWLIVAFGLNAIIFMYFYIAAIKYLDLSIAAPIRASSSFFGVFFGIYLLSEQLTLQTALAALLIFAGILILTRHNCGIGGTGEETKPD